MLEGRSLVQQLALAPEGAEEQSRTSIEPWGRTCITLISVVLFARPDARIPLYKFHAAVLSAYRLNWGWRVQMSSPLEAT